jgi:hypothetical protein
LLAAKREKQNESGDARRTPKRRPALWSAASIAALFFFFLSPETEK